MATSDYSPLIILILFLQLLSESLWAASCDRSQGATAIPSCRQVLQNKPQDVGTLVQYANILLDLGRASEAVELLEASHGKSPTNSTIRLKLSDAREAAQKPAKDSGPSSRTMQKLSVLRCKTRTGQSALEVCNIALKNQPQDVSLLLAKGDAFMSLNRATEAAQTYRLALAQDKANSEIQGKLKLAVAKIPEKRAPLVIAAAVEIEQIVKFSNASIDGQVSY